MKKGISYWSFPGGLENTAPYGPVFRKAAKLGFDSVECAYDAAGVLSPKTTEAECKAIRAEAKAAGVEISSVATGVYWTCSLTANRKSVRDKAVKHTKSMIRIARWLGADSVLVVPGAVNVFFDPASELISYDEVWKRSTQSLRACLSTAKKYRVRMCLENVWNKFLVSPMEMCRFIDQFKSPYVKCYFDTGNVIPYGYPEHWIKILGRRLGRVHFKDHKWRFLMDVTAVKGFKGFARGQEWGTMAAFCDLGAGDVDWPAVMKAFKAIGYDKYVTAEMVPPGPGLLSRTSRDMDKILGRKSKKKAKKKSKKRRRK